MLETTQFALVATVHKLYFMIRNSQPWTLGEPELNDRGDPIIHNIAQTLDCIRPNTNTDLPMHSVFPKGVAGVMNLARQLDEQQLLLLENQTQQRNLLGNTSALKNDRADRVLWSDFEDSESDHQDYLLRSDLPVTQNCQSIAINGYGASGGLTLTPQSFPYTTAICFGMSPVADSDTSTRFDWAASQGQGVQECYNLQPTGGKEQSEDLGLGFFEQDGLQWLDVLNRLVETDLS